MLQHCIIQFSFNYLFTGLLQVVKNKKISTFYSSKSGCSHVQEVAAYIYMRGSNINSDLYDLGNFGILGNWSLRRGGRNWRLDCINERISNIGSLIHVKLT